MSTSRCTLPVLLTMTLTLLVARAGFATDLFVDNRVGDDIDDGRSPQPVNDLSGPVKSISRALKYARAGDTVHIANHGVPYFESLELVGPRFSEGFTIEGNGAVVSGARTVPFEAWKSMGNEVWRFTPRRKAFYQLISGDRALPEYHCPPGAASLPEIPAGHWCAWRGSIYYRVLPGRAQTRETPLAFAAAEVGITLLDVEGLTIHNLELRHFRLDGVNAHDRCKMVILDGVRLFENGRAGLAVGGSSLVGLKDSLVEGNRVAQVLNAEVAQTEVLTSQFGPASLIEAQRGPFRITGGHILVDGEEVFEKSR